MTNCDDYDYGFVVEMETCRIDFLGVETSILQKIEHGLKNYIDLPFTTKSSI